MSNPVVHFEIPADDMERAQGFYSRAFGWSINSMPGMRYTLLGTAPTGEGGAPTEPGSINGGMLERQDPVQSPVITINVPEIDAALAKIQEVGGGTVREKWAVGDMGFAAYFTDSEGNVLGLWETA